MYWKAKCLLIFVKLFCRTCRGHRCVRCTCCRHGRTSDWTCLICTRSCCRPCNINAIISISLLTCTNVKLVENKIDSSANLLIALYTVFNFRIEEQKLVSFFFFFSCTFWTKFYQIRNGYKQTCLICLLFWR